MSYLNQNEQLSLPLQLPDDETFQSFYPGENQALLNAIQLLLKQQHGAIYCWSGPQSGRSHLLYAACAQLAQQGQAVGYVPLEKSAHFSSDVLMGMEQLALVCLDNIEAIVDNQQWQVAVFDLYNRLHEVGKTALLMTADRPPRQLAMQLQDLSSRLSWGQTYRLLPLSEEDKLAALQLRSHLRGIELSAEVGRFLIKRLDRNMRSLMDILAELDKASMAAQRKLTIPFVKSSLNL